MTGYSKLFGSIITSTIWREDKETKILWITMLALKDKNGDVEGSVPGLADMARLTIEETEEALEKLRSPDPHSRTKENEGRRIEDVDGGWHVLNHKKYRDKMNSDERREYLRIKQAEHREKKSTSVNKRKQKSTLSTHAEADAYTDPLKREGSNGSSPASVEDWLKELEADKTYAGIDVRREYGKMLNWCKLRRKQPNKRRFINWINQADKPLPTQHAARVTYKRNYSTAPEAPEVTDEERARLLKIAAEEKEKLRRKLITSEIRVMIPKAESQEKSVDT